MFQTIYLQGGWVVKFEEVGGYALLNRFCECVAWPREFFPGPIFGHVKKRLEVAHAIYAPCHLETKQTVLVLYSQSPHQAESAQVEEPKSNR